MRQLVWQLLGLLLGLFLRLWPLQLLRHLLRQFLRLLLRLLLRMWMQLRMGPLQPLLLCGGWCGWQRNGTTGLRGILVELQCLEFLFELLLCDLPALCAAGVELGPHGQHQDHERDGDDADKHVPSLVEGAVHLLEEALSRGVAAPSGNNPRRNRIRGGGGGAPASQHGGCNDWRSNVGAAANAYLWRSDRCRGLRVEELTAVEGHKVAHAQRRNALGRRVLTQGMHLQSRQICWRPDSNFDGIVLWLRRRRSLGIHCVFGVRLRLNLSGRRRKWALSHRGRLANIVLSLFAHLLFQAFALQWAQQHRRLV
mmetsp:Transcript_94361/g.266445  ORF Transcript_94361/g.266445 Transcript_94361/m.266445 type:complete len:311 (-) Transcript_94361:1152-2084(-)